MDQRTKTVKLVGENIGQISMTFGMHTRKVKIENLTLSKFKTFVYQRTLSIN